MKYKLIIFFLIFSKIVIADNNIDSLLNLYNNTTNDSLRLLYLDDIISQYSDFDTQKAIEFEKYRAEIFHKQDNFSKEINSLYNVGVFYYYITDYQKAILFFIKGINLSEKYKFDDLIFSGEIHIGNIYFQINEIEKAYEYYNKSLKKNIEQKKLREIAICYNNIGNICSMDSSYGNSKEYYLKALKIKEKLPDTISYIKSLGNMCLIYMNAKQYEKALTYGFQSLNLCDTNNINHKIIITELYKFIGNIYSKQKKYSKSSHFFDKGILLAKKYHYNKLLFEIYLYYSQSYEEQGKINEALIFYKKYSAIKNEIFNINKNKEILKYQIKYETENNIKQNDILQKQIEINRIKISRQNIKLKLLIIIIILTFILIIVLFNRFRIKHKLNIELEKRVLERTQILRIEIRKREITEKEIKRQNKKLIKAKQKAEESNQLKTEFINNMSHEIRTPLNGILGFSQIIEDPSLTTQKRKQFITIIQNSANQLMRIIDNIIEISRLGTKQVRIIENEICINDLLLELFSIFNIKAKEKKIPLYLKKNLSDKESTILTDETKLNKILSNLLENAFKFTHKGYIEFGYICKATGHAPLSRNATGHAPLSLQIYVKDTGLGIQQKKHETIFDRFSQEDKGLTRKFGGLGLGLSIAQENAKLLGGKITLKSEKGKGTTFFVTIPYKPVHKDTISTNHSINITNKNKNKYTILIVEDEQTNYLYIDYLLENFELNLKTLHAKNGEEALELCNKNPEIDFVFMDLKLPIMNGFETTKKIKSFRPNLPIVAQTAYSTKVEKEKAISAGCDDFISKPISEKTLLEILHKYLIK